MLQPQLPLEKVSCEATLKIEVINREPFIKDMIGHIPAKFCRELDNAVVGYIGRRPSRSNGMLTLKIKDYGMHFVSFQRYDKKE